MELISLEQYVDISLLLQMKHLLFMLSSEDKQFMEKQRNGLFGQCVPVSSVEEQYGLNYPGEVLERYEERCGGGERQIRAIMLALAEGKNLLEGSMFVGRQLEQFLRKVRLRAEEDFYLSCALFLFRTKRVKKIGCVQRYISTLSRKLQRQSLQYIHCGTSQEYGNLQERWQYVFSEWRER